MIVSLCNFCGTVRKLFYNISLQKTVKEIGLLQT